MTAWIKVRDPEGAEGIVPAEAEAAYVGRDYEVIDGPTEDYRSLLPDISPPAVEPQSMDIFDTGEKEAILEALADAPPPVLGVPDDPAKEAILDELADAEPALLGIPDDPAKASLLEELAAAEAPHTQAGAETAEAASTDAAAPAPADTTSTEE